MRGGDEQLDFFEKRIRPVLVKHCYECHSAKSRPVRAGLLLDSREGSLKGGESGAAVVPGEPDESLLLGALRHDSFEMPPKGQLPQRIIDDFEKWIASGAHDPRTGAVAKETDRRASESFWSYQPIRTPAPPNVDSAWPANAIDRFILARLAEKGLRPADLAEREVLLRRLTFDLHGLPPSEEQREQFLNGGADTAYAELVDALLDSHEFGERWARHWLDVARFAESTGGGRTKIFDSAWRYRDYVIRSFNADKPFSRFAQEQVAGDLLPHEDLQSRQDGLIATGFLVLGPINYELQDKELLQMEVIDEQLDVMGRALLGLSIGCARCHDHKFDRLSISEYYSLAGVMHSTHSLTPGNVSGFVMRPLPVEAAEQARIDAAKKDIGAVNVELAKINKRLKKKTPDKSLGRVQASSLPGVAIDNDRAKLTGEWTKSTSVSGYIGNEYVHDNNSGASPKSAEYSHTIENAGRYEIRLSYTASSNRATNTRIDIKSETTDTQRNLNQRKRPPIDGRFASLGSFEFQQGEAVTVTIRDEGADGVVIADCVQWVRPEDVAKPKANKPRLARANAQEADEAAEQKQLAKRKSELERQLKDLRARTPSPPLIMSVQEQDKPADFHICVRGNVHQKGHSVARGFPSALSGDEAHSIPEQASGRLQLANWLVDPQNPRTSRVFVNRVWRHLMGAGIVRTPDDFGPMGNPPSHPMLLDHLASEFMKDGWSLKRLIRGIVMSKTYRLSARADDALRKADPDNLLFGRHEPRRLDAEALRDAMLSVTGVLDRTQGGKTLKPNTRTEFGYSFDNVKNRRSIYVPVLRNSLHDFLAAFDLADPNLVSGNRTVSTLPAQSLLLMNSPDMRRLAQAAAERLLSEPLADDEARVHHAFIRFLGRPPTSQERELAEQFLTKHDDERTRRWTQFCHSLLASVDFRYVK